MTAAGSLCLPPTLIGNIELPPSLPPSPIGNIGGGRELGRSVFGLAVTWPSCQRWRGRLIQRCRASFYSAVRRAGAGAGRSRPGRRGQEPARSATPAPGHKLAAAGLGPAGTAVAQRVLAGTASGLEAGTAAGPETGSWAAARAWEPESWRRGSPTGERTGRDRPGAGPLGPALPTPAILER